MEVNDIVKVMFQALAAQLNYSDKLIVVFADKNKNIEHCKYNPLNTDERY